MVNKKCTLCNGTGRIVTERHSEKLVTVRQCPRCNKQGTVVNVGKINQEWMRKR
ncbi:hypothetical protein CIRMBP1219_02471 [Enterococcus cecorum]|nr:hypothetical protein CIRMBP1219_02471 [Enterococcus cecorum]